ncbi:MAG TPA: anthranilate phosphoribosyltransferase [Anaerolineae bacterium]|nr:anthranilate phosphoribosyltransferase [Anaerolineae bacterium]
MSNVKEAIGRLIRGDSLGEARAEAAMTDILDRSASAAQVAAFLAALRIKGETIEELIGCARAVRKRATAVSPNRKDLVDICGTGDDRAGTFNISTTAALVAAGAGLAIAKHGNRSASGRCGSADLLEALGVNLELTPQQMAQCIDEIGFGFLFAPLLEPELNWALNVARELGVRTTLHVLDPLINPAGAAGQVLGVYSAALVEPVAYTQRALGIGQSYVVYGADGMDEFSTTGVNKVSRLDEDGMVSVFSLDPADIGLRRARLADVAGGDLDVNVRITQDVLAGKNAPPRDIVVLNAAAALVIGKIARNLTEGVSKAQQSIDSRSAARKLEELVDFTQRVGNA